MEEQVCVIFSGTRGYLDALPVAAVGRYEQALLATLRGEKSAILESIRASKKLDEPTEKSLIAVLDGMAKTFTA
jgi:F-type H+-transporting ATPase subunit alpha